ncbi:MAG: tRNA pseudouridine synthase A [Bacteroidetes bacterium CG18_big_fil_WC_8_21_14_2_50_41_14]|nr:MAG: tRNA pseudouridine synthase A [Bacteroidetes bacterium CG18_big_fil_WC_8_21_14_2_50_41_14]PIY30481.1 MAG: tRNA pseudouridine synthase A [Bacteroidetes bacterium CG_4_10_14_3_um_filter_42_6]PJB54966.1 MAG: tRNA pseudouridine synthase A [Bacteroidetes bacterium CG_4_9_14_3_um_filter_41_19]
MQSIRLEVSNKVCKHLMWFLSRFSEKEIRVIKEDTSFLSVQEYMQNELLSVNEGTAEYIEIDQLEDDLEKTIRKHEA